jgi:hypothetical protein
MRRPVTGWRGRCGCGRCRPGSGVYFVLGLCLFSGLPYGQVLRELSCGREAVLAAAGWQVPASTALTGVRRRVGDKPLESLFRWLCSALSPGRAPWSHAGGLLAVAWDGTTVDTADSRANRAAFGRPGIPGRGAGRGRPAGGCAAAYPQLRLVMLVACGTRGLLDAAIGPLRGAGAGERELARELPGSLHRGMLLLAGRGFCSYGLRNAAAGTGAHLLWRAKNDMRLPVARELPDGSWLTHAADPRAARARRRDRPGPDLLHRSAARPPPHHHPRPRRHGRRPGRRRSRDPHLPGPRARRPDLPPDGEKTDLPVRLPARARPPHITARQLHHHHHRTQHHHAHYSSPGKTSRNHGKPAALTSWHCTR